MKPRVSILSTAFKYVPAASTTGTVPGQTASQSGARARERPAHRTGGEPASAERPGRKLEPVRQGGKEELARARRRTAIGAQAGDAQGAITKPGTSSMG